MRSGESERSADEVSDRVEGGLSFETGGTRDGAISGVDLGTPVGSKPVGDLAEDDGGSDLALGDANGSGG